MVKKRIGELGHVVNGVVEKKPVIVKGRGQKITKPMRVRREDMTVPMGIRGKK